MRGAYRARVLQRGQRGDAAVEVALQRAQCEQGIAVFEVVRAVQLQRGVAARRGQRQRLRVVTEAVLDVGQHAAHRDAHVGLAGQPGQQRAFAS